MQREETSSQEINHNNVQSTNEISVNIFNY